MSKPTRSAPAPATARRDFLRLLALAPAAAAVGGCASAAGAAHATRQAVEAPPKAAPGAPDPLVPIRAVPLAMDAEPAFVFRAAPARPGE